MMQINGLVVLIELYQPEHRSRHLSVRVNRDILAMSALLPLYPPKTDIHSEGWHVSKVPSAEVTAFIQSTLRRAMRCGRHRDACFPSTKLTSTPFLTDFANRSTSQFVILTQPCDSDLLTRDGSAVP